MKSFLSRIGLIWRRQPLWVSRNAIRADLFGVERLEQHARSLAAAQHLQTTPGRGTGLIGRLRDNARVLLNTHHAILRVADDGGAITPAATWLLDNYYLVERQIHDIWTDLPPGYYRQLPKLADGPFIAYPRIFSVSWAFIAHGDSRFDPEALCRYVSAYQEVDALTIGELWALAITLRITLVENLRRLADAIVLSHASRRAADFLADRILGVGERPGVPAPELLKFHERSALPDAFAAQLVYRLRDQDPRVTPALTWLDERLALQDKTSDSVVRDELQRQGAASVTVQNIITSMRLISDVDWSELVERLSVVDTVLAAGSPFAEMDFATRNLYRSAIESFARGSALGEVEIAAKALELAHRVATDAPALTDERRNDPGYFLLAGGRKELAIQIGFKPSWRSWYRRVNKALGIGGYAAAVGVAGIAILAAPLGGLAVLHSPIATPLLILLPLLGIVPALDLAVALVNRGVIASFGAFQLPALALREGIPGPLRTLVAVPVMLTTPETIAEQVARLEVHYLASPDGELHFALLSDWVDAPTERLETDAGLLALAAAGIVALNQRYGPVSGGPRFFLLHRRRVWSEGEGCWLGWERKRGKLHELNRLLRGATDTTYISAAGLIESLPGTVRYIVTLDADTRLPRDTVRRLIGKMAHPLNRPRVDPLLGRVVEGYAVMQPRVTPSLPIGCEGSLYQRTFSSMGGIDPYAAAVSDVYQDLFGEGSFAGKGIYEIDAFEAALDRRVPDSTLLSHDLFEGVFARAGLASDIEVVEEFPARYDVDALRQHRWARGDWQLLPWILGLGPVAASRSDRGGMPAIGRWKMVDNLRRSLSPPLAILALFVGWLLPFPGAAVWTGFVLGTIMIPPLIPLLTSLFPARAGVAADRYFRALGGDIHLAMTLAGLRVILLADQGWRMADAIVRTLFRLLVSRRHLLQWVTAAQTMNGSTASLPGFYRRMPGTVAVAMAAFALVLVGHEPSSLVLPLAVFWLLAPSVAWWISFSPSIPGRVTVSDADSKELRLIARRTWAYFERFVTIDDNMLPPDNFQETPLPVIAHRTSPTNIGLYLLAVVAARDFGWLGTVAAIERLEATFATLGRMERCHGHFLNWYDTQDLRPLDPRYISAVDSGNLAGHLIALANACREWRTLPTDESVRISGIRDAIAITREELGDLVDPVPQPLQSLAEFLGSFEIEAKRESRPGEDLVERLSRLTHRGETLGEMTVTLTSVAMTQDIEAVHRWTRVVQAAIAGHRDDLTFARHAAGALELRITALEQQARAMAMAMEFGFLFDQPRKLLSIGYLVAEGTLDPSCYDLLASEARLASFFAIAKGDIPSRHWFRLGRTVTPIGRGAALISWSGSMFEYLMPSLVMRAPAGSLIEQTNQLIVRRQIAHGAKLGVPWGISESAYNARDLEFTYQYSNFGVPGLGLKRGLATNLVIAPYATALAAMIDARAALQNLERLSKLGARGQYGFYEALDYTPARLREDQSVAIVRAYMAHHQGMTIVALADTLLNGIMRTRFHAEPIIQATELLLQERMPRDVMAARPFAEEARSAAKILAIDSPEGRRFSIPHTGTPATHLLSNGQYTVMLTAAGSGYSRWRDLAITRWREDPTADDWGSYLYLRDSNAGALWSAGFHPIGREADSYAVVFKEDRAEICRRDGALTTVLDVIVSAEDASEVRRVSITNSGSRAREIDITSYAELVLGPVAADVAHPAFSKLFIETEYLAERGIILATRRRRSPDEPEIWAAHLAVVEGETIGPTEIETDRARFLGRSGGPRVAAAIMGGRALSNTVGAVLDPIFALRRRVRIAPGGSARIAYWTMVASSRAAVLELADTHRDAAAFDRAATLAWTGAQVQLHHLGIDQAEANLFQQLAGYLLYSTSTFRPGSDTIRRGSGGQAGLWSLGISGDLPIILLRVGEIEHIEIVRQLLRAHEYLRTKRLAIDVVILNERASSYVQDLQEALERSLRSSQSRQQFRADGLGGRVFVLRADLMLAETRALLMSVARLVLVAQRGRLLDQLDRAPELRGAGRLPVKPRPSRGPARGAPWNPTPELFNGLGGFAKDGREYVTILGPGQTTPAPWINVIANPGFGFQVSTEGSGYTWAVNSRENQLTPWSNDPVSDRPGEAFYIRDDDAGDLWTPTALPIRDPDGTYVARHGRGYSHFEYTTLGISAELQQSVSLEDPIKISRLILRNLSDRVRHVSVTGYVEWVMSPARNAAAGFLTTEIDTKTGAMFARNPWSPAFNGRVAFIDFAGAQREWTGDRREFLGRNGNLSAPAALLGTMPLSGTTGAGLDPCGALRAPVTLPADSIVELVFMLGEAEDAAAARALITRYREMSLNGMAAEVARYWDDMLEMTQVRTPDRALDIMLNGWLLYQTIVCRIFARSAFYQSSGAYGFRDQLQDGMAVATIRPDLTRAHLLRAGGRQFIEGDVQHWWLAHTGQGVRTRISDDRVWLGHAVAHYVGVTGDLDVLDESLPFLEARALEAGEHDNFSLPLISEQSATLYEHCARALDHCLATGLHGLPLIGTGDWNDGMNRVGEAGRGESVWLGWFLFATIASFVPLALARQEDSRVTTWQAHAVALAAALEREGWDGEWYRRGFFDDGTPFGSAVDLECRIDSIAQSWAVLSKAANVDRARQAMDSVDRTLILEDDKLALLFAPPFDKTAHDPGYIKGYPPGIRENGGQYTHAALWAVMAFAALGDGDRAGSLLSLLNPVNHTRDRNAVARYKVEPYVVAADVYAVAPHSGRGGWTWYTGSAGWMYRAGLESLLGIRIENNHLTIDPCVPRHWNGFDVSRRQGASHYDIRVDNPYGVSRGVALAEFDGVVLEERPPSILLTDDGARHRIRILLG